MKMRLLISIIVVLILSSFALAQECDYEVEILLNATEFTKESFKWRMRAKHIIGVSTNITGIAGIEDLNNNIVKNYKPWTNLPISKQKTSNEYSPNLNEGSYKIISEIFVGCDDTNKGNNIDIKAIKIVSGNIEAQNNVMQRLSFEEQQNIMQIKENEPVDSEESNKSQNNVAQNEENSTKIYENTVNLKDEENTETNIRTTELKPNKEEFAYVSSSEKSKNLIVHFLLAVSIIFNIVLIWKRQSSKNL